MKCHLSDHPHIYVLLSLRCNYEIAYTHHMTLKITVQVLGRYQSVLTMFSNNLQSQWS